MPARDDFDAAVRAHDAALAARGRAMWVGSEPTFTDRHAQTPEWVNVATGGDKESRARGVLRELASNAPGAVVLRSEGRRYPGEDAPRFSVGLYARRDATPLWRGPPDPMFEPAAPAAAVDVRRWANALCARLAASGRPARADRVDEGGAHVVRVPGGFEAPDTLAFRLAAPAPGDPAGPRIELPPIADVPLWSRLLGCVERSARDAGLSTLIIAGAPPPVDALVAWTTVTPDQAVLEVNTAPSRDATEFLRRSREVYAAATAQRLDPYRLYYNCTLAYSCVCGQITL